MNSTNLNGENVEGKASEAGTNQQKTMNNTKSK